MDSLVLKIGIRVMVVANIDIADGVVNGSMGKVMDYLFHPSIIEEPKRLKAVLVQFDSLSMGQTTRNKYLDLSPKVTAGMCKVQNFDFEILHILLFFFHIGATPIFITTKEFVIESRSKKHHQTYKVTQFPLRVAEASTAHKFQGITVEESTDLVLHGSRSMPNGMSYVMLSRAKSINSVYLHDTFKIKSIRCPKDAKAESIKLDER